MSEICDFTITADHFLKIIRYKHTGVVKKDDLYAAWRELVKLKEFTQLKYNLLTDYRHSKIEIQTSDFGSMLESMNPMRSFLNGKKQSIIIDDPISMATTMLFIKKATSQFGMKIDIFSTEEAATNWLLF